MIAPDLPGFGGSEPIDDGDDVFVEHIATIVSLLDHLGLAKATVVGHSMGGVVALQLTCDHPGRITGLMLTNAGGANIGPERLRWILAVLRLSNVVLSIPWVPVVTARFGWLRSIMFAAGVRDRRTFTEPLAAEILPSMSSPGFVRSLQAAAEAVNHVTPQSVTCPCLIVWGTQDQLLPMSAGHELLAQIPDARFVPLEGVGHCPMVEVPEQFNALLADFVRDLARCRPVADTSAVSATQPRRRNWWWRTSKTDSDTTARSYPDGQQHQESTEAHIREA
jgi:pimeloyl-ACP methyl ester carboxylesterase